jgi:hypothetical protein
VVVDVRQGDAARPELYADADAVAADLLLLAGVFGNISDEDVRGTIHALPLLCAPGARVIWTRHREEPDLTPQIRSWFADEGFEEQSFTAPPDVRFTVGVHDLVGTLAPRAMPERLFTFFR